MRLMMAFSCFFRLLFFAKLHPRAAEYLPATRRFPERCQPWWRARRPWSFPR